VRRYVLGRAMRRSSSATPFFIGPGNFQRSVDLGRNHADWNDLQNKQFSHPFSPGAINKSKDSTMDVLVVDDEAQREGSPSASAFFAAIDQAVTKSSARVAFDCEGVNLSRKGTLEVLSLFFEDAVEGGCENGVFLVDLGGSSTTFREKRVDALKRLLECPTVTKIIHDCRMDSDALFHHFGITLHCVHDTACFHQVITGMEAKNLNDTLSYYGMDQNAARDKSIYKRNPKFWATRPMTNQMISWASSDVDKLPAMASKQDLILEGRGQTSTSMAEKLSLRHAETLRSKKLAILPLKMPAGRFIGTRGANIRSAEKRTGAFVYKYSDQGPSQWMVYYSDDSALLKMKREMGY